MAITTCSDQYIRKIGQTVVSCTESKRQLGVLLSDKSNFIVQRSPEWYKAREGTLTASTFYDICVTRGATAAKIVNEKMYPDMVRSYKSVYGKNHSYALFHGCRCESVILPYYEWMTGTKVHNFGLVKSKRAPYVAASPDGINDLGVMVEFKCPVSRDIIPGKVPVKYLAQIFGQLYSCELKYCDYFEAVIIRMHGEKAWLGFTTKQWFQKKTILMFTINTDNEVDDALNWTADFNQTPDEMIEAAAFEFDRRSLGLKDNEFIEIYYCIVNEVNHVLVYDKNNVMEKDMLPRIKEVADLIHKHSSEKTLVKPLDKLSKIKFDHDLEVDCKTPR